MADILHHIKAYLHQNQLTDDPDDFTAKVSSERTLGIPEVCLSAVGRGGAPGTAGAMEQNVRFFFEEMLYLACDGYSINTGYFILDVQIKGVFNKPVEKFNPDKHSIYFRYVQGDASRKQIPTIEVTIMGLADVQPAIREVIDVKTGALNSFLTPGKALRINGEKIKVAGGHPDVGVWFVSEASGERFRVDNDEFITNNPSELAVMIPGLAAGTYTLEVVTQFNGGGSPLKNPRTATFAKPLTVQ